MGTYRGNEEYYKEKCRNYRANNYEAVRLVERRCRYRKLYGITIEEFDEMLEDQNGRCAICQTDTPGRYGRFHVDHDHTTGKVRGLLCNMCNISLGGFKDSLEMLQNAIAYLKQSSN